MKTKCTNCNGTGRITKMEPKWWGSSRNGVALHGYKVPKVYTCTRCTGTGRIVTYPKTAA